jgi:hypothetical protein
MTITDNGGPGGAPVTTKSWDSLPWPPDVLNQLWSTILEATPFTAALTPLATSSGSVAFPTSTPSGGAFIAELDPIPEADLGTGALVVPVRKAASMTKLSNEARADTALAIGTLVGNAIKADLGATIEHELLYGTGDAPNPDGVMNHASAATAAADLRAAAIGAFGELASAGASPTSIVVFAHPSEVATEWARVNNHGLPIHDDAASADLTIGPGLRVISVPALEPDDVLVADVTQIYRIERDFPLSVETSEDFYFNLDALAIRVKARLAAGVPTPAKSLRKATISA